MSNRGRWLVAGLVVVAAVLVAVWPRSDDASDRPNPSTAPDLAVARSRAALAGCAPAGAPVPAGLAQLSGVSAECLADGSTVDLAGLLAGRPALVNVWATWCQPCQQELPVLAEYAAAPGAVPVLGVAVRSDSAGALELLTRLGVRFTNLADSGDVAWRALRVPDALPASYLVGADGTVHFVSDPRLFDSVEAVRASVARYLPAGGTGGT